MHPLLLHRGAHRGHGLPPKARLIVPGEWEACHRKQRGWPADGIDLIPACQEALLTPAYSFQLYTCTDCPRAHSCSKCTMKLMLTFHIRGHASTYVTDSVVHAAGQYSVMSVQSWTMNNKCYLTRQSRPPGTNAPRSAPLQPDCVPAAWSTPGRSACLHACMHARTQSRLFFTQKRAVCLT